MTSLAFGRATRARTGLSRTYVLAATSSESCRSVSSTATVLSKHQAVTYDEMVFSNPLGLPRLPIPRLEDTVQRYLQSLEPLTRGRPDDLARASAVADGFLKGDGPVLHSMVVEKDKAQRGYPHSYIEKLWDDMYLQGRWSLPINSNPYLSLKPPPKHAAVPAGFDPQITGAVRFISSFLKWNRRVRDGTFQPDAARPGCVRGYALQGGVARVARKGRDEVNHHPASRHAVVFCNNRAFRVNLLGGEEGESQISEGDLRKFLEDVRASAFSGKPPTEAFVGHLTCRGREEWASARAALKEFSTVNKATLFEIDSALLTVALDDHETPDLQAESRAFLTGDVGRNRWFDKHQLIVLKNGGMAVNFEHSFSDGMDWTRMLGEIWHDMYSVESKGVLPFPKAPLLASAPPPPRELQWKLPHELMRETVTARKEFNEACEGYTLDPVEFQDFGKGSCKEWKLSPDAVAQMAFQLAFKRLHDGAMPSTYESCTTRWFFRGRTETIRSCTTESANFASAMDSESKGKDTRRAALDAATSRHVQMAKAASQGQGVDRHIYAMRAAAAAAEAGDAPGERRQLGEAFFGDPLTAESSEWRLSTSNLSVPFLKAIGFGPVTPAGYGLGYIVGDDHITIPVTAFRGGGDTDGKLMAEEVVRALRDIGDVCR